MHIIQVQFVAIPSLPPPPPQSPLELYVLLTDMHDILSVYLGQDGRCCGRFYCDDSGNKSRYSGSD